MSKCEECEYDGDALEDRITELENKNEELEKQATKLTEALETMISEVRIDADKAEEEL